MPNERQREFENLIDPHLNSLYSTALRMTHNQNDAEDLVQDTLFKAYRAFDQYQKNTNFLHWQPPYVKCLPSSNTFIFHRAFDLSSATSQDGTIRFKYSRFSHSQSIYFFFIGIRMSNSLLSLSRPLKRSSYHSISTPAQSYS